MSTLRPQRRRTAATAIAPQFSKAGFAYETLRRQILDGGYHPGDRLRLAQIARQLALSEMPVREALRLLQRLEAARHDARDFARRNRELLTALYARAPNEFLRQHIQALWDQVWRFSSTLVFEFMPGRLEATILENRAIVAAVARRDRSTLHEALARRRDDILAGWQRAIERARKSS